jgi:AAA15 family ATPase/GTPase
MKIVLKDKFKSLKPFESCDLESFAVLVGKNGSGKSQLVELFSKKFNGDKSIDFELIPNYQSISVDPIKLENLPYGNPQDYRNQTTSFYGRYQQVLNSELTRRILTNAGKRKIEAGTFQKLLVKSIDDVENVLKLISTPQDTITIDDFGRYDSQIFHLKQNKQYEKLANQVQQILQQFTYPYQIATHVAEVTDKEVSKLEETDFHLASLPEEFFDTKYILSSVLSRIFYAYLRKRNANIYNFFRKIHFKETNNAVDPAVFNEKYKSPWSIINQIFVAHNLPYYFKEISEREFIDDIPIKFQLIKKGIEEEIPIESLSSGEKIILGIILKLFTVEFYDRDVNIPEVIVLDEPDAHLHPELCKILVSILNNTFVRSLGIKVIITTHSPSTISLAPEECLFQIKNVPSTTIEKISKDEALKNLLAGVSNLSVDYKNHRQVLLEGSSDLKYYQSIYDKMRKDPTGLIHPLYFISLGKGRSSCNEVIKLVDQFRRSGNNSIYGIIDWDLKHTGEENIRIHEGRYSIENFIFDPLFLSVLLLQKKFGPFISEVKYQDDEEEYFFVKENAQQCIYAISKIFGLLKDYPAEFFKCTYGTTSFELPNTWRSMKGHDLQILIQSKYPVLSKMSENLIDVLVTIAAKMFPFVPSETIVLLNGLSRNQE